MKSGLSLYVWEGVFVDYTDGIAFALAKNEESARMQILQTYCEGHDIANTPEHIKKDLEKSPKVYDNAMAQYLYGGG
jgi:hypothetical protein